VVLCDDPAHASVLARIDLKDLERSLGESQGRLPALRSVRVQGGPSHRTAVPSDPLAAVLDSPSQLPLLNLFKRIGEVLLESEGLDAMLQKVINLTIDNLPGRRGVICLYDEKTGTIEPKVFRTKASEGDRSFMVSRSILNEAIRVRQAMLVASAVDDPRFHKAVSVHQMGIRAAMCVPLYHAGQIRGLIYVDSQHAAGEFDSQDLEVLTVLGLMVAGGITQMMLRGDVAREQAMRARLSRYNSPHVVEQILSQDNRFEGEMLADEYEASVLFADLTGFTAIAENLSPADVVRVLNLVFEELVSAVFDYDGTLDKYIGDAVMAVFGAPLRVADHATRAVRTAMLMQQRLAECIRNRPEMPALQMRIGINSGKVIAGDIGSPRRRAYTVIGDVVNIASRLETSVAQPGDIVVGSATWELVKDQFECDPLAEVQLRGKRQTIRPYRVLRAVES
jgi:adenylate cyclase